jgi:hypothetical protein
MIDIDHGTSEPTIADPDEVFLPPEHADGTWLHMPDPHRPGYADLLRRDDATAYTDAERIRYGEHWYSYHRRAWISWKDAVRLGAASARVLYVIDLTEPAR